MTVVNLPKSDVTLCDWNVLQLTLDNGKSREFFIGYILTDQLGRLSTPTEYFDEEKRTGITQFGSTYTLAGEPGKPHDNALYVLESNIGADVVRNVLLSDNPESRLRFRFLVVEQLHSLGDSSACDASLAKRFIGAALEQYSRNGLRLAKLGCHQLSVPETLLSSS